MGENDSNNNNDDAMKNLKTSPAYTSYFAGRRQILLLAEEKSMGKGYIAVKQESFKCATPGGKTYEQVLYRIFMQFAACDFRVVVDTTQHRQLNTIILGLSDDLNFMSLKVAHNTEAMSNRILQFEANKLKQRKFKFGVMLRNPYTDRCELDCFQHQEMDGSAEYHEFLSLMGKKVELKNWEKFSGGLNVVCDATGTHSYYTTMLDCEVMYHVSTCLPHTPGDAQQLAKKRHIGNDIILIIFNDNNNNNNNNSGGGGESDQARVPFSPSDIRSHFIHVVISVEPYSRNEDNNNEVESYEVSVAAQSQVRAIMYPTAQRIIKKKHLKSFLLSLSINYEIAAMESKAFLTQMKPVKKDFIEEEFKLNG